MTNPVGGFSRQITPTITVSTGAYTSGDVVGGAFEIAKACRHKGSSTTLQTLLVTDVAEQDAALELLIFDSEPDGTFTDNAAAPTLGAADIARLVAKVTIAAADYVSLGGLAVNDIVGLGRPITPTKGGTSLWGVLITSGTPTYAATTDLALTFGFFQD